MSDSYQRNGNPESSRWRTTQDEFRGYMRAKLEDLEEMQEAQWNEHRATKTRVSVLEKRGQYVIGGLAAINIIIVLFFAAVTSGLIYF